MGLFKKLFGGGTPGSSQGDDMWAGIPALGQPMASNPELKATVSDPATRQDTTKHALLALAATTRQFAALRGEGIYLFDLFGDPTLVCKMSEASFQKTLPRCEFFVEAVAMPTHPILRVCLEVARREGTGPLTFERLVDVQDINIQQSFGSLLRSPQLWIHVARDEAPVPRFTAQLRFDQARVAYYPREIATATKCFKALPAHTRNLEQAVVDFHRSRPMG